jgi:hypothetical protein
MNKNSLFIAAVALLAAPLATAGDMLKGQIGGHLTMTSVEVDGLGPPFDFDDDGNGFGIRGWGNIQGPWMVHGEYQTVTLDETDIDVDQFRFGGGYAMDMWLLKLEYIDTGSDLDQSGLGFHGGVRTASGQLSFLGTVGYLSLDDASGPELNAGVSFAFTPQFSGVLDLRTFLGSLDPDGDLTLTDIRIGGAYNFR